MSKIDDAPCAVCSNKGCGSYHSICVEYNEWRKRKERENEKKSKERDIQYQVHEVHDKWFRERDRKQKNRK